MKRDIRDSKLYREVEAFLRDIHAPGENRISDAADPCVSPDGRRIAITGTVFSDLSSPPVTRIGIVDAVGGQLTQMPCPANSDRLPRWSPDGTRLAFLSDRLERGNSQLFLAGADDLQRAIPGAAVDGFVEYLHWSPDGRKILLGVAGFGADLAGCQGGATISARSDPLPDWLPSIDTGDAGNLWRSIHIYDLGSDRSINVSRDGRNYWEAAWLGNDAFLAVVSDSHSEGSWYRSELVRHGLRDGREDLLYSPGDQIGLPTASPSGNHICVIEAVCSDRLIVCGDLKLIDTASGIVRAIDTDGVDVAHVIWRDDDRFLFAGHRGFHTIIAECSISSGPLATHWSSIERTSGAWYPSVWPSPSGAVVIAESYDVAPELVEVENGDYRVIESFAARPTHGHAASAEPVVWQARDRIEMQGWLIRPPGPGPFPLVMDIHGGPVWQCRNRWAGRLRGAKVLADHGVASFYPNPRGSSGRGQDFARLIKGDMGGEDTHDYLSGCDMLVARKIADPDRLGVTGISYGGFMSCWLITQDDRFAAAAPISCVSDWYSQHRTSQIPYFDELFLNGSAYEPGGRFFERSPVMFAANVKTPTLQLTGALDQNTPPTQALEFHRSLLEHGVRSQLAIYPTAGHGVRSYPEVIDATTRYVGWFLEHFA